jgi:ligand-binding sensor domain-containing protein
LTTGDGRVNNDAWTILEDRKGHLWVGTRNTGLWSYDGKSFTILQQKMKKSIILLNAFGRQ